MVDKERVKEFYKKNHTEITPESKKQLYDYIKNGKIPDKPTLAVKRMLWEK